MEFLQQNWPEIAGGIALIVSIFQAAVIKTAINKIKKVKTTYIEGKKDGWTDQEKTQLVHDLGEAILAVDKAFSFLKGKFKVFKKKGKS